MGFARHRWLRPRPGERLVAGAIETLRWLGREPAEVALTSDGGAHWAGQRSGTDNGLESVAIARGPLGWVVGEGGTILTSVRPSDRAPALNAALSGGLVAVRAVCALALALWRRHRLRRQDV